jgi:hypothetical protein
MIFSDNPATGSHAHFGRYVENDSLIAKIFCDVVTLVAQMAKTVSSSGPFVRDCWAFFRLVALSIGRQSMTQHST